MDMNNIVAVVFFVAIFAMVGYNAYKNMLENKARKAEVSSLQAQIGALTDKLKALIKG